MKGRILKSRSFATRLLLVLALVALFSNLGFAQQLSGTLRGQVLDPSGAVVVGAKVTATNGATGVSATVETTSAGTYSIPNLLPGIYTVTVSAPGFTKHERTNVVLAAGLIAQVNVTMELGSVGAVVEVTAGAELVNTTSSSITETFQKVYDLPIGGQGAPNVLDLAVLMPNVTAVSGGSSSSLSVGGNRDRFINYTIDGVDNNSYSTTSRVQNVIPDAVQELVVNANVFTAEYGHSAGANFNVVTRTGTNEWHGGGYWYNQNRNYNAMTNIDKKTLGATSPPRFDQQRVGGSVGGPVLKNRLFAFGAYEWFNQGTTAQSTAAQAPTSAGLATLKGLAADSAVVGFLNKFPVASTALPQAVWPTVNNTPIPVGDVVANASNFDVTKNFIVNGDLNLGKNTVHTRYLDLRDRGPNPGAFPSPEFSALGTTNDKTAIANVVTSINPLWVNDAKVLYQRTVSDSPVPPGFAAFPNVTIDEISQLVIGPDGNLPQSAANGHVQLQDNMAYTTGRFNLKWGVEYRKLIGFDIFAQRVRGDYEWDTLQNFVNDIAPTVLRSRNIGPPGGVGRFEENQSAIHGFFQTDVKVTPRLTLNLGVRYEWNNVPAGVQLNVLNSIANVPGNPDLTFGIPKTDKNNISPRFGFAWDPTGSGKWSIRGGAAVAYDQFPGNFYLNEQPSQISFFIFQTGGAPSLGPPATQDCAGTIFAPPAWCGGNHSSFLAAGGIPNVTPNIQTQAVARSATSGNMTDQTMPKIIESSIGVQHEIWRQASVEVRYQFTRGLELPVQRQVNAVTAFDNGASPLPVFFSASAIPSAASLATAPSLADFNAKVARPYASLGFPGSITTFAPIGANRYHAVSVDYNQRSRWGFAGRASYTWSRNFDDSTADLNTNGITQRRPQDINHLKDDWGRSGLDITHKATVGFIYTVPRLRTDSALLRKVLHGWEYGVTTIAQTGQPATAYAGRDTNGNGDSAGDRAILNPNGTTTVGTVASRQANFVCRNATVSTTALGCGGNGSVVGYVPKDATQMFISTPVGALSNIPRNSLTTPGLQSWNMSLAKNTYFGEKRYLQLRADVYNVWNHRNFSFGQTRQKRNTIASSGFSNTNSSSFLVLPNLDGGSRVMQLGLRIVF